MATFKKHQGLSLYYNSLLRSNDATGNHVPNTYLVNANKNLVIGRNINSPPYHYAAFDMSSLFVFQEYLYRDDVSEILPKYFVFSSKKFSVFSSRVSDHLTSVKEWNFKTVVSIFV